MAFSQSTRPFNADANLGPQMSVDATPVDSGNSGSKTRLLSLGDIDRRTRAYRKTTELIVSIETDLGGADRLSTAERQIIQRAALTGALLEDLETRWLSGEPIDAGQYATLSNAQRRLFETVGLRRVAREVPSLGEYLAKKAAAEPAESFSAPPPSQGPDPSETHEQPSYESGDASA
jgi:hypothetical protein